MSASTLNRQQRRAAERKCARAGHTAEKLVSPEGQQPYRQCQGCGQKTRRV